MATNELLNRLAGLSATLVDTYDVTGVLVRLVADGRDAVGATSAGLLVLNRHEQLETLTATSHRAADLEAYQAASGEGPCSACMDQQSPVALDVDEASRRWPEFGALMQSAGYDHILATPLRWHGTSLGGLNLFFADAGRLDDDQVAFGQVYADALTLTLVHARPLPVDALRERLEQALQGRVVIEQAKGVLAQTEDLTMEDAFDRLLTLAEERSQSLTQVAQALVDGASQPSGTP
jgi:hypothetical protein